jgi:hypothetical protein
MRHRGLRIVTAGLVMLLIVPWLFASAAAQQAKQNQKATVEVKAAPEKVLPGEKVAIMSLLFDLVGKPLEIVNNIFFDKFATDTLRSTANIENDNAKFAISQFLKVGLIGGGRAASQYRLTYVFITPLTLLIPAITITELLYKDAHFVLGRAANDGAIELPVASSDGKLFIASTEMRNSSGPSGQAVGNYKMNIKICNPGCT